MCQVRPNYFNVLSQWSPTWGWDHHHLPKSHWEKVSTWLTLFGWHNLPEYVLCWRPGPLKGLDGSCLFQEALTVDPLSENGIFYHYICFSPYPCGLCPVSAQGIHGPDWQAMPECNATYITPYVLPRNKCSSGEYEGNAVLLDRKWFSWCGWHIMFTATCDDFKLERDHLIVAKTLWSKCFHKEPSNTYFRLWGPRDNAENFM